eukprot:11945530-Ditylum_brightwellii.AAC.1
MMWRVLTKCLLSSPSRRESSNFMTSRLLPLRVLRVVSMTAYVDSWRALNSCEALDLFALVIGLSLEIEMFEAQ